MFRTLRRQVRALHEAIYYRPLLSVAARLSDAEMSLSPRAARERLASVLRDSPLLADFGEDAAINVLIAVALSWPLARRATLGRVLAGVLLVVGVALRGRAGWLAAAKRASPRATLRKLLGEAPDGGRYIVNVPLQGYCFVATVQRSAGAAGEADGDGDGDGDGDDAGGRRPSFALWAPTAQAVTLLTWETGDPLGRAPEAPGPPGLMTTVASLRCAAANLATTSAIVRP